MIRRLPWRAARSSARSWTRNSSGRVRLRRRPRSPWRLARCLVRLPAAGAADAATAATPAAPRRRRTSAPSPSPAPCLRACRGRSRTARPRRAMSSTPLVTQELRSVQADAFGAGVARGRQIVGELDVRVEADAHAVGGRRRPPPLGLDRRRRPVIVGVVRGARELLRRRIEDHLAGACRRSRPAAPPGPARWRCAGRRPPARRAIARESRCDRCGCRRRWRSRGPSSSPPARRATASARRRSAPTTRRARAAGRAASRRPGAGSSAGGRPDRRRRPCRSRRYGSATSSNTALNSWNTCWTAHSALTRCSRTIVGGARHQHRVVEHQQLRVEQRRQLRAAAARQRAPDVDQLLARPARLSSSRASSCSSRAGAI